MRLLSILAALVVITTLATTCEVNPANVPSGADDVYDRMTAAYEANDLDAVGDLYTEDAAYIIPNGQAPVLTGRDSVVNAFEGFLKSVSDRGATASIDFRFVKRHFVPPIGYDVGYYRTTVTRNDSLLSRGTGKFTTVLRLDDDGVWRFAVDAYTPAPDSLFDGR